MTKAEKLLAATSTSVRRVVSSRICCLSQRAMIDSLSFRSILNHRLAAAKEGARSQARAVVSARTKRVQQMVAAPLVALRL